MGRTLPNSVPLGTPLLSLQVFAPFLKILSWSFSGSLSWSVAEAGVWVSEDERERAFFALPHRKWQGLQATAGPFPVGVDTSHILFMSSSANNCLKCYSALSTVVFTAAFCHSRQHLAPCFLFI